MQCCVSRSSLESCEIRGHDVHLVWSRRADLGGVGTTRAMRGPRNIVALWSTGPLGCRRGAKLGSAPARATHAGLGRQPACGSSERGATRRSDECTSHRRSKSENYSKNSSRQQEADEGAYEVGQRLAVQRPTDDWIYGWTWTQRERWVRCSIENDGERGNMMQYDQRTARRATGK